MKRHVAARTQRVVLVCGKCSRKIDGGFGEDGRTSLAKALRRRLGGGKGRKAAVAVIETKCLDVCPKKAVVVIDAAAPGRWLLVPAGASLDTLAGELVLETG